MQKNLMFKLGIICLVSLLLLIPLSMISGKIFERSQFLAQAKHSVSNSWTGKQTVMTAIIVIPYEVINEIKIVDKITKEETIETSKTDKYKFLIPEKIAISSDIENTIRQKGIYKIPVYTSKLAISGLLSQHTIKQALADIKQRANGGEIGQPFLTTTVSDPRGINSIPTLTWNDSKLPFNPGSRMIGNNNGIHAFIPPLTFDINKDIAFEFELALRGMETLAFIPVGKDSKITATSPWPHPEFIGSFLPISRDISSDGYQATWAITPFASNIDDKIQQCEYGVCDKLLNSGFGVKHIEAVDVYLQSERSVKYAMLFIGLSFISFFIFEILMKLPIHPIQYTLVGFAIALFYLLLISLSEHINFFAAYAIASLCCCGLLLSYLRFVLAGMKHALLFASFLLILYAALYIIVSAEDLALVMGSFLTFTSLAVVMFSTRNIDWYQVGQQANEKAGELSDASQRVKGEK